MIQSLVYFHGIEVDAFYLIVNNVLNKAGRFSTKMLADYCSFYEEGEDGMGWTDISEFKFSCIRPGIYEIIIDEPKLIEPIKWEDVEKEKIEWTTAEISQ